MNGLEKLGTMPLPKGYLLDKLRLHIFPDQENYLNMMLWGVQRPMCRSPSFRYKVLGWLEFLRIQRLITIFLGPQYRRSRKYIEIDLTYICNLKCNNCNRSCAQVPSEEYITLDQIQKFVDESIKWKVYWHKIRLLGGEPTLHPNFLDIIQILNQYKRDFSPDTRIEVVSNGYGSKVNYMLSRLPNYIIVENSKKDGSSPLFFSFNMAPKDQLKYKFADFTNACWITEVCGMGLTPLGYYPCAVGGGIDRIFKLNLGTKNLPSSNDDLLYSLNKLCRYCGHFKRLCDPPVKNPTMSKTWEKAYETHINVFQLK